MTAFASGASEDPRLMVEDDISAGMGVELGMVTRIRPGDTEWAWMTVWRHGATTSGVAMRLTEADLRQAASVYDRLADELGKRKAERR